MRCVTEARQVKLTADNVWRRAAAAAAAACVGVPMATRRYFMNAGVAVSRQRWVIVTSSHDSRHPRHSSIQLPPTHTEHRHDRPTDRSRRWLIVFDQRSPLRSPIYQSQSSLVSSVQLRRIDAAAASRYDRRHVTPLTLHSKQWWTCCSSSLLYRKKQVWSSCGHPLRTCSTFLSDLNL